MSDIQSVIKMLQSDNHNKRYDACEELRVLVLREALPQEAIHALNFATNDPNPDVADAAQRALSFHTKVIDEQVQETDIDQINNKGEPAKNWLFIGLFIGLVPGLVYLFFFASGFDFLNILCIGPIGILGGIIGAGIGRGDKANVWVVSILISILGAFLGYILAALNCLSCQ